LNTGEKEAMPQLRHILSVSEIRAFTESAGIKVCVLLSLWAVSPSSLGQPGALDWQQELRQRIERQDWSAALHIIGAEIANAPNDYDLRAWRARILTWSGAVAEAEQEYQSILLHAPFDPDNWNGLASVYLKLGRNEEAVRAVARAVELDPNRSDLRSAYARALRAVHRTREARHEFETALKLDPKTIEAQHELQLLHGETKHELRIGMENDLFNFMGSNYDESVSLASQWSPRWRTAFAATSYQRAETDAERILGSLTASSRSWGALTIGAGKGHDNSIVPKTEVFFDLDHGWRLHSTRSLRGLEVDYGQHWYWYTGAQVLALNVATFLYLPRDFIWSVTLTCARSNFPVLGSEWRPSGITKLGFPLLGRAERRLSGNAFFAAGTENFAQVDQIGRFSSQTYGTGLRFQMTSRQDTTGYAAYQRRDQARTEIIFGFTYGVHF
jgi:tetratricopeptide (TPR) repeat protein